MPTATDRLFLTLEDYAKGHGVMMSMFTGLPRRVMLRYGKQHLTVSVSETMGSYTVVLCRISEERLFGGTFTPPATLFVEATLSEEALERCIPGIIMCVVMIDKTPDGNEIRKALEEATGVRWNTAESNGLMHPRDWRRMMTYGGYRERPLPKKT